MSDFLSMLQQFGEGQSAAGQFINNFTKAKNQEIAMKQEQQRARQQAQLNDLRIRTGEAELAQATDPVLMEAKRQETQARSEELVMKHKERTVNSLWDTGNYSGALTLMKKYGKVPDGTELTFIDSEQGKVPAIQIPGQPEPVIVDPETRVTEQKATAEKKRSARAAESALALEKTKESGRLELKDLVTSAQERIAEMQAEAKKQAAELAAKTKLDVVGIQGDTARDVATTKAGATVDAATIRTNATANKAANRSNMGGINQPKIGKPELNTTAKMLQGFTLSGSDAPLLDNLADPEVVGPELMATLANEAHKVVKLSEKSGKPVSYDEALHSMAKEVLTGDTVQKAGIMRHYQVDLEAVRSKAQNYSTRVANQDLIARVREKVPGGAKLSDDEILNTLKANPNLAAKLRGN